MVITMPILNGLLGQVHVRSVTELPVVPAIFAVVWHKRYLAATVPPMFVLLTQLMLLLTTQFVANVLNHISW